MKKPWTMRMQQFFRKTNKTFPQTLVFCIILMLFLLNLPTTPAEQQKNITEIQISETFSPPIIQENNGSTMITLKETNTWTITPGEPKLPTVTKTFELPKGAQIQEITCTPHLINSIMLSKPMKLVPPFYSINGDKTLGPYHPKEQNNHTNITYPSKWFTYTTGAGLNNHNNHVLFLSVTFFPIRYNHQKNTVEYVNKFTLTIKYSLLPSATIKTTANDHIDLVIITPREYEETLTLLQSHKTEHGVTTAIKTTEEIYDEFQGRDNPEKIKYFIKYAIENWNTTYVLLIGDIKQLPIRTTDAYPWGTYHGKGILSDLYYADIYDETFNFCTWDKNNNNIYGEVEYGGFPPKPEENIDDVDLYPDVHIGRIPCSTIPELSLIINKIITYEETTYDQIWFQKIILVGGDTFPLAKFAPPFVYEGEITNQKVAQQLPEFEHVKLWASKHNLNAITFNHAVSQGAGFLSYAGHGFEHGWGTYRPNAILDHNLIFYFTPYLKFLRNDHRLPIVFFDACLTAKLDFNITDLEDYFGLKLMLLNLLPGMQYTPSDYFPCFAWCFLKKEDGGSIATIGATRPAYTYVDKYGVYAGAGYLDVHFFKAYEEGITLGEMLTHAQNDYINNVGKDFFTIEEFILLGDPSLLTGGYP